jgi:DNA-binding transcriptional ArsR family regulator
VFGMTSAAPLEADLFRVLADPTRRAVLERLAGGEMTVSDIKAGFSVSQPAISQHLAALRAAGLVSERREGRFAYYRAEPEALDPLIDWIDRYRAVWPARIEKLKDLVKRIDR